jgi:hypothetical protein
MVLFSQINCNSLHFTSLHFTSLQNKITAHKSRHFTPYHFTPHHFTPHHFTAHHFTSHHFTPHHFTPHHYASHHFTKILKWILRKWKRLFTGFNWLRIKISGKIKVVYVSAKIFVTSYYTDLQSSQMWPRTAGWRTSLLDSTGLAWLVTPWYGSGTTESCLLYLLVVYLMTLFLTELRRSITLWQRTIWFGSGRGWSWCLSGKL